MTTVRKLESGSFLKTLSFSPMLDARDNAKNTAVNGFLPKTLIAALLLSVISVLPVHSQYPPGGIGSRSDYRRLPGPAGNDTQKDYWSVWTGFRLSTENLLKKIGAENTEAASLLSQTQTNAAFLEAKWNVWFSRNPLAPYEFDDKYLASLQANNRLLNRLKKEKDEGKALETLRDVAMDLQLKADNCRNSSDGLGKRIKVKVHTKAGEKEVGGYEVFYVPKGMLDVKSAHDRFPRQSSPTDERVLSPGGYAMWVRKDAYKSEPITLGIGGRGETELEVDVPVPAE